MTLKNDLNHFLRSNELGTMKKQNRKKIYSYIYPNKVYSNVKIPDCFFKKFTTDGKLLIGFTQNLKELKAYKYLGLGKENCTPDNIFDKYFELVYSKKLDENQNYSKHFCLITEDCDCLIVAAVDKQRDNRICVNKCLNNITFILIDIKTGETLDKYTFKNDYICLVNHSGVNLHRNLIAFISIQYQEITILKITENKKFKFYKKIGKYIHNDDEEYLKQFKHLEKEITEPEFIYNKKRRINIGNNFVRIVEPINNNNETNNEASTTPQPYIPTHFVTAASIDTSYQQQQQQQYQNNLSLNQSNNNENERSFTSSALLNRRRYIIIIIINNNNNNNNVETRNHNINNILNDVNRNSNTQSLINHHHNLTRMPAYQGTLLNSNNLQSSSSYNNSNNDESQPSNNESLPSNNDSFNRRIMTLNSVIVNNQSNNGNDNNRFINSEENSANIRRIPSINNFIINNDNNNINMNMNFHRIPSFHNDDNNTNQNMAFNRD